MKEDKNYYIVDKSVLPEIFLKVMDVKNLFFRGQISAFVLEKTKKVWYIPCVKNKCF